MAERKDLITDITLADADKLLGLAADLKSAGYRLGQACATKDTGCVEVLYSFDKDVVLKNVKVTLDERSPELHSITSVYPGAFIYENEMHDLFGIKFRNLSLDYGGKFFKIAAKTPWNPAAAEAPDESDKTWDESADAYAPEHAAPETDIHDALDHEANASDIGVSKEEEKGGAV